MDTRDYLKILVDDIHSSVIATIDGDGKPTTRVIDLMLFDEKGVYFLTAKGKEFYRQLTEQGYISLSATKGKISVSLKGNIENIGSEKLDEIFEKNTYMQGIYPGDTRKAIEVFRIYKAQGEFFDISNPENVTRDSFSIGGMEDIKSGYYIGNACVGCGSCYSVCPQKCIDISDVPFVIDQNHCLHCGECKNICPVGAVEFR